MGYTHNTNMSIFIPPACIQKSAGTWTPTLASNVVKDVRTANDSSFNLFVPITGLIGSQPGMQGAKIKTIDVFYAIGTAAADAFATVELEKMALPANDSAVIAAAVTHTVDAAHDTSAERYAIGNHTMTLTITTPFFLDDGDALNLYMVVDCAATTVFSLFGVRVNFELRL